MAHLISSNDKYSDFEHDDAYRSYLITRIDSRADCRFGSTYGNPASRALRRVRGYLKTMIEAIASSKLRRMERELELRGIRHDRAGDRWVTRDPVRASVRQD